MLRTLIICFLIYACLANGISLAASGETPKPQEPENPANLTNNLAPQTPPEINQSAIPPSNSSDSTVSLKDYVDRELEKQWSLITSNQNFFKLFVQILSIFVIVLSILGGFQIGDIVQHAKRDMAQVKEIKIKMEKTKEEAEKQYKELMAQVKKECDELVLQSKKQLEELVQRTKRMDEILKTYPTYDDLPIAVKNQVDKTAEEIEKIPGENRTALEYFFLAYITENPDEQIKLYSKAIELNPFDAEAYNNRGFAYYKKGDYDYAIQDFDKAIQLNPYYAAAFNNRGNAYLYKGCHDRAIQDYNKAIQLKPDYALPYYNKACSFSIQEKIEQAFEQLEIASDKGFIYLELIQTDKYLDNLRSDPRFADILKKIEENAKKKQ